MPKTIAARRPSRAPVPASMLRGSAATSHAANSAAQAAALTVACVRTRERAAVVIGRRRVPPRPGPVDWEHVAALTDVVFATRRPPFPLDNGARIRSQRL